MKLQTNDGKEVKAIITTGHPASNCGLPVLIVAGEAIDTVEAIDYSIISATDEERQALRKGGYRLPERIDE